MIERVFEAVPIGEARAVRQRDIWKRLDIGAETSVRQFLEALRIEGRIYRRQMPIPSGFTWMYWREAE